MALLLMKSLSRQPQINLKFLRKISLFQLNVNRFYSNDSTKDKTIAKAEVKGEIGEVKITENSINAGLNKKKNSFRRNR